MPCFLFSDPEVLPRVSVSTSKHFQHTMKCVASFSQLQAMLSEAGNGPRDRAFDQK